MLTENLSTLKINRLTQEQYDTALTNGTINDNELYMTPEETIELPTNLSDLAEDENHRLVTDSEKTAWNNKASSSDVTDLRNLVGDTSVSEQISTAIASKANSSDVNAHTGNTDIHVTTAQKATWDAKAEVFNINISDSTPLTSDKTYNEILEAYNSGKILRITAEGGMLEGIFLSYAYNTFLFGFVTTSNGIYITADEVGVATSIPAFVPSASISNAGKILMVGDDGHPAWTAITNAEEVAY